jgi:hypothetical protein
VDEVFSRILAKQPGDRYGSCREFIDTARVALGFPMAEQPTGGSLDTFTAGSSAGGHPGSLALEPLPGAPTETVAAGSQAGRPEPGSTMAAHRQVQRQQRARQRRIRILIGVPTAVVVIAVVAVVAVLAARTHGPGSSAASSAMAAAERTGASGLNGPVLAGLDSAAQGATVNGIQCQSNEQTVYHIHAHLAVFVNGAQRSVPYGIGIPGGTATQQPSGGPYVGSGTCFYWLHTHDQSGVIHIESPVQKLYTLGDFFGVWGQPLAAGQVGAAKGTLTGYVNGTRYTGDPRAITLNAHTLIQLDIGANVPPQPYTFPASL